MGCSEGTQIILTSTHKAMTKQATHAVSLSEKVQHARELQCKIDDLQAELENLKENLWINNNYNFTI